MKYNFYFLNSAKPARIDGWDDLVDYLTLCHEDYEPGFHLDAEDDVTLEEIETEDGSVFEVVCVEGRPVGTCRVPATGDLLAILEPRRKRKPAVIKAMAAFDAAIDALRAAHDREAA